MDLTGRNDTASETGTNVSIDFLEQSRNITCQAEISTMASKSEKQQIKKVMIIEEKV